MALKGLKVIELAGMAPSPVCGMILSDFGAKVIKVDRVGQGLNHEFTGRGKRSVALNLKKPEGVEIVRKLCNNADVLIEPFRPGVMERLGLGPSSLIQENPKLIYARMTGFGQSGPYKDMAGHDINYLALSGVLSCIGRKNENPLPPVNLLADFAGGSFTCAMGIMAALLERTTSGKGQVIDSCMVEGAAYVGSWLYASKDFYVWGEPRGCNILDSGAHFYETYKTKDGKHVSVGAIEPQFYKTLLEKLEISSDDLPQFDDFDELKAKLANIFATKTRDEWSEIFDKTDACVVPILDKDEAPNHYHNKDRGSFLKSGMPRPAPLLSRTPAIPADTSMSLDWGQHTREILAEEGYTTNQIDTFLKDNIAQQAELSSKL